MPDSQNNRKKQKKDIGPSQARKADKLVLASRISLHEALRQIVENGLAHLMANYAATLHGDHEGLHQTRVAIRRLRSALVLFEMQLDRRGASSKSARLRRYGRVFGAARDWDVFIREILPKAGIAGVEPSYLSQLRQAAGDERSRAYRKVDTILSSQEFSAFAEALRNWVEDDAWSRAKSKLDDAATQPLCDLASSLLDRLARKAHRRGKHIADHSWEELHELRKTMKKLRYGAEYLSGLYKPATVRKYLAACEALQGVLGEINDAASTGILTAKLVDRDMALLPAANSLSSWAEASRLEARAALSSAWDDFQGAKPFWQ